MLHTLHIKSQIRHIVLLVELGVECPSILIDHSKIQKSNIITRYPDMIHVQCDIGYQLNGNGSIQCTESGDWSNMPSCSGKLHSECFYLTYIMNNNT